MNDTKELKPPHWILGTVLHAICFPFNCAAAMREGKAFIVALRHEWALLRISPMACRYACEMWRDGAQGREDERLDRPRNSSEFRGVHHDDGETSVCE